MMIELKIEAMCYGTQGLARHEGKAVFVDGALVGDRIEAEITDDRGSYAFARVVRFVDQPGRTASLCSHSGECGGCPWIELPYPEQAAWKHRIAIETLQRIGKVNAPSVFVKADQPWAYRNRVMLRGTVSGGRVTLGYFKGDSHEQVPVTRCAIAGKRINDVIRQIQELRIDGSCKFRLTLQELPAIEKVVGVIHVVQTRGGNGPSENISRALIPILYSLTAEGKTAPILPWETRNNISYHTSPGLFQQVNLEQNHKLRSLIQEHVAHLNPKNILDLFCGTGNISLGLADGKRLITGIEYSAKAIEVANHDVAFNKLSKIQYKAGDCTKFLKTNKTRYDLVITDPPRMGMKDAIPHLLAMAPRNIIYISCDPSTLARDLKALNVKYDLTQLTFFDFFPNSYHVESVAYLTGR